MVTSPGFRTLDAFIWAMRDEGEFSFDPAPNGEFSLRWGDPRRGIPDRGGDDLSKRLVREGFLGEGVFGSALVLSGDGGNGSLRGCRVVSMGRAGPSCAFTKSESELRLFFLFIVFGTTGPCSSMLLIMLAVL